MDLSALMTDGINELLVKIVRFTRVRQKILVQNINNIHCPGYMPKDLTVAEFCRAMENAIDEYRFNRRLLLRDSSNIKFGKGGRFQVKPLTDDKASALLEKDPDAYLELQVNKLLENAMNQRIAAELLRQRQPACPVKAADHSA
jgi:flagellar basal body rod protein FlgB